MSAGFVEAMAELPGFANTGSTSFDPTLVALSFVISVFGSVAGLQSARRAQTHSGIAALAWLVAAAVSIGGGAIWSMHFVGMLAYQTEINYSFDIGLTSLSFLVAVVSVGVALYLAGRGTPNIARYLGAGAIVGIGVAGMHYLGMRAMQMSAAISYRWWLVAVSVAIAILAATLALFLALAIRRGWTMIVSALALGAGVCALYYLWMSATTITADSDLNRFPASGAAPVSLALPVFAISSVLLFVLLLAGMFGNARSMEPTSSSLRTSG